MIQTVYDGTTVFLVNDPPNLAKGYSTEHAVVLDGQSSLTKRETRRAYSETLRTTVKCASTVADAALRTLLGQLRQLKAQPVVCPFWPAASFWSVRGAAPITGGLMVAFKPDWSQFAIWAPGVDADPVWPAAGDYVAPLIWGFFAKNAEPVVANGSLAQWDYELTESSQWPFALSFAATAWTDGPKPAGYAAAPKILPFRQDYRKSSDALRIDLKRESFGFTREQSTTLYPHDVYRGQKAQFTLGGLAAASNFLAFFQAQSGQGASFWVPSALESGRLAAPCLNTDVSVTLTGAEAVQVNDYLCAVSNGGVVSWGKVTGVVGNVVTFAAALGVALPANAQLFALNLAEMSGQKLTLSWRSPTLVVAEFSWTEVRPEAIVPGTETIGQTIGQLPKRIVLLDFWRDYGNGTTVHQYFTSYERDCSWNGHTWASANFDVDEIAKSLNLEDDSLSFSVSLVNLDGSLFADCPLLDEVNLVAEVPLNVSVYFAYV